MVALALCTLPLPSSRRTLLTPSRVVADAFPPFLPNEVHKITDPLARSFAMRIQRLPVKFSENPIMSSCVMPVMQKTANPVVLLHGFDSSCLEWRYAYPLIEEAGFETWAIDILGWGFSDLEKLPSCDVVSKRHHLYQGMIILMGFFNCLEGIKVSLRTNLMEHVPRDLNSSLLVYLKKRLLHCHTVLRRNFICVRQFWKSYIRKPMILVGPSLGSAVAIDFIVNYPEAVEKLVLIDSSVYAEGTGKLATLPRAAAYAGVYLLKSIPLRLYANYLTFSNVSFSTILDWTKVSRLHCLMPWWEDATVDFMTSGGYNVASLIKKVKHKTLVIWGENDRIISNKLAVRLHSELPNAILHQIPNCGHLPHVERPSSVVKLIVEFIQREAKEENLCVSRL